MKRVFFAGLSLALALAVLAGTGCSDNAAKDKDPAAKAGTNLGSKDLKQASPNAGDKKTGGKPGAE